jgi:tRNA G18 (ribose-2'-O)-methylase SpoU
MIFFKPSSDPTILEMNLNPEGTREEAARARRPKQDIILVATLVDKIPNIAGLTRTAEIFQASQLVIGDSRVLQDHAYQVISVTADKWVPIIEVREPSLGDYLLQKKAEGYALLGGSFLQNYDLTAIEPEMFGLTCCLTFGFVLQRNKRQHQ